MKRWRMPVAVIVSVTITALLAYYFCELNRATTVIVLRHAEKEDPSALPDPQVPLSAAGLARAQTLAQVLERAGVSKIYVSDRLRTQQTAQPLATARNITPVQLPANDVAAFVNAVRASANVGRVIVVVGHSNTVPQIVSDLGGGTVTVADNQFDNLFVLSVRRWGTTRTIQATYGEPR